MTSILQIDPPLPMETPKGKAWAHFLYDYGIEANAMFGVFLNESGEFWIFQGHELRIERNLTLGRDPTRYGASVQAPQSAPLKRYAMEG